MRRDPRIRPRSPSEISHRERLIEHRQLLERTISDEAWEALIPPLVGFALATITGSPAPEISFPANGDLRVKDHFETVRDTLLERKAFISDEDFGCILVRRIAKSLADILPADVNSWVKAAALFRYCENWADFIDSIPTESIENRLADLTSPPPRMSDCLEEGEQVFRDQVDPEIPAGGTDPLEVVWQIKRTADYRGLEDECQVKSVVLRRTSPVYWSRWLEALPETIVQLVALNGIEDLEFLNTVLVGLSNRATAGPEDLLFLSVVWRTVSLWEEIDDGISQAERQNFEGSAVIRDQWLSTELPRLTRDLVSHLGSFPGGVSTAALLLRHVSPFRGPQFLKLPSRDCLRNELLALFQRRADSVRDIGLLDRPSAKGLTVAGYLALNHSSPEQLPFVFDAYSDWICNEDYIWHQRFEEPDKELLGILAAVLAKSSTPIENAQSLIQRVKRSPQGWNFSYASWLKSVSKLSHVLVVIALAADSVVREEERGHKSASLMKLAWDEFHSMFEQGFTELRKENISSPVAYIWACAGSAFEGGDTEFARSIRILGDPTLVVLAAQNLSVHGGLTEVTRAVAEDEINQLIQFYRHARNFSAEYAERILESVRTLETSA